MGQKDHTPPTQYIHDVQTLLREPLGLLLPDDVLVCAGKRAFARGLEPREAVVLICQEHNRCLCRQMVEQDETASDLVEFAIASRIEGCAELADAMNQDLLDLLPDLPYFVHKPCFSDEFRDVVARIAAWYGIPEHRWSAPGVKVGVSGRGAV